MSTQRVMTLSQAQQNLGKLKLLPLIPGQNEKKTAALEGISLHGAPPEEATQVLFALLDVAANLGEQPPVRLAALKAFTREVGEESVRAEHSRILMNIIPDDHQTDDVRLYVLQSALPAIFDKNPEAVFGQARALDSIRQEPLRNKLGAWESILWAVFGIKPQNVITQRVKTDPLMRAAADDLFKKIVPLHVGRLEQPPPDPHLSPE